MADITFVNSKKADAGYVSTLACGKPDNTAQNDLLIALVHYNANKGINSYPSEWQRLALNTNTGDGFAIYYKIAGNNEPSSYTWGLSGSTRIGITICAYRNGFDVSDPFDSYSDLDYYNNNTTLRAGTITVSETQRNLLFVGGVYQTSNITFTPPSALDNDWIEDFDGNGYGTSYSARLFCRCNWSGSGATGDVDVTMSSSGASKHAFLVSLNPASVTFTPKIIIF